MGWCRRGWWLPPLWLLTWLLVAGPAAAAPKAELWPYWQQHNPSNTQQVDHSAWQAILDRYLRVDGQPPVTRFDYQAVTASDRDRLAGYLEQLQAVDIRHYPRAEQKAFWINLYNALTVKLVLDHYPVASIRDIEFGWFSFGPWGQELVVVSGKDLSLDAIEHRILRPVWQDNRIHYGVNCASVGCPNLAPDAHTAANTERLLEQGARQFINHPRGVSLQADTLYLSSIYDWFQEDFGGNRQGVMEHLMQYADPDLRRRLSGHSGKVRFRYDWRLNSP